MTLRSERHKHPGALHYPLDISEVLIQVSVGIGPVN